MIPETKVPSHQRPDAQTVFPDPDITTIAPRTTRLIEHHAGTEVEYPAIEAVRATQAEFMRIGFKRHEEPAQPVPTEAQLGSKSERERRKGG
ncbi:MAG TPA: hypothetical protein VLE49_19835 [Anaerolineales bacterium]|nr:hypothetical protein [Anaerolineales bacterium]